ncbi:TetR family transcriptional regulator [Cocleimonas sp. KMM 6892]|uniref:TetR family transcriptional regulator n=1 Tax=unclassified Cocleimonas TaxID=2639732 RepID=UPI002DB55A9C|nr:MULTISPECIES: TetR family transcriptional regulator [unclassified Cocleimonas]MEB8431834.1 TetR family transcriptional regulator [Cocleimonas sp. KMM 6892]MEC4715080.1 TetR family transcriptional regulator [Cocleimonas sp. KMM 6895]MEC4744106.1 TetR family transcriptional regulator [Cocleimonas sp. KMM 6896]
MARKTKEDAQKTFQALLEAAQRLFIKQGIANTTLNQIAKEAGMTRGALYWHFENKDALIMALWEEGAGSFNHETTHALENLSENENPADTFRLLMHGVIGAVLTDPKLSQSLKIIMNCVEITDEETPLRAYLQEKYTSYFTSMAIAIEHLKSQSMLKVELSANTIAAGLLSYLYGMVNSHLQPSRLINLENDGIALIDLYLNSFIKD